MVDRARLDGMGTGGQRRAGRGGADRGASPRQPVDQHALARHARNAAADGDCRVGAHFAVGTGIWLDRPVECGRSDQRPNGHAQPDRRGGLDCGAGGGDLHVRSTQRNAADHNRDHPGRHRRVHGFRCDQPDTPEQPVFEPGDDRLCVAAVPWPGDGDRHRAHAAGGRAQFRELRRAVQPQPERWRAGRYGVAVDLSGGAREISFEHVGAAYRGDGSVGGGAVARRGGAGCRGRRRPGVAQCGRGRAAGATGGARSQYR